MQIKLNPRLKKIAENIPVNSDVIDVGSDHAHLPIYLIQNGICKNVLASDLRSGPCEKARENIALYGLSDRIKVVQTNGLEKLGDYPCSCIVIAGMGAQIMTQILKESNIPKNENITLILQPQKYQERLRKYLSDEGFLIDSELLVRDGRLYTVIAAHYTGKPYRLSEAELYLGKKSARKSADLFPFLAKNLTDKLKRIIKTKENAFDEERLLALIEADINGEKKYEKKRII